MRKFDRVTAFGGGNSNAIDVATTLNAKGTVGRMDFESETFVTHALRAEGFDGEDGTGRGIPLVPVEIAGTLKNNHGGGGFGSDPSETFIPVAIPILEAGARTGKSTDDPRAGMGVGEPDDPMFTLQSGKEHAVAFSCKDHGADAQDDIAPTLRSMNFDKSHANAGGQLAVAFDTTQITSKTNRCTPKEGDPCHPLASTAHPPAIAFHARQDPDVSGDVTHPLDTDAFTNAIAFNLRGREDGAQAEVSEVARVRAASGGSSRSYVGTTMAVRRLLPVECERLQGFEDNYTLITYRGKPAADGPRYRALGNSFAVTVVRWIGLRIQMAVEAENECPLEG